MAESTDKTAPIGIALLGVGTVGGGVLSIVRGGGDALAQRTGVRFDVRHAVARDPAKYADLRRSGVDVTTDAEAAIDDPAVEIVVELIGGVDRAGELVRRALERGKPVVTANKSLLAAHGAELFALARANGTCVAFEASCAGGLPVVNAIATGLVANRVDALVGILNGTTNVILTRMGTDGLTYAAALKEAQDAGFAEADPTMDVSGRDAAQKLAILASIAFGRRVDERQVHVEGVESIDPVDLAFARSLGYAVKLLAIASREPGGDGSDGKMLSLRVHPALVPRSDVLADVAGPFNAVGVYGDAAGHALFYGRGAGRGPTASAVVADLVSVATGAWPAAFAAMRSLPDLTPPADALPFGEVRGRHYLRLFARDVPGVMADVAAALGRHGIGLSAIHQREAESGAPYVPIVITTHRAREADVLTATAEIDALPTVRPPTVRLRIHDPPREFAGP